ncbi:hypothetical protein ABFT23_18310 [Nocardioides sp. C4-1]|uniref:hypothetical protein n=1 Tax=Nocardioides sp. C4-1 TaxID=3151851 RepID=UPI003264C816
MTTRRPRAAVAAAVTGLLLAACGGGSDDGPDGPDGAPGSGSTSAPSPTASGTPTASESATAAATGDDYLPVPDGRVLDPPGTALRFGEPALVAWKPRQDVVGVVGVQVDRVRQTTPQRSLKKFTLDARARASTVYFVSTVVGNGGDTDLGGRQLPIYVVDSQDRLVAPTGVDSGFEACPGSTLSAVFAPGDRARSCLIFLVAPGATLTQVMFRPPEGVVPITWTGDVTVLGAKKPKARRTG